MSVDLSKVRVTPAALVEASRQVAASPVDRVDRATGRVLESFATWATGLVDGRELEIRGALRRELREDADPELCRRVCEALRIQEGDELEAAVERLSAPVAAGLRRGDESAVAGALAQERRVIEALDATADVRAVRLAENTIAFGYVARPVGGVG